MPDAVAPPPHHPRFPLLDGLRAVAVLAVVVVHVTVFSGVAESGLVRLLLHLNIGVTIFFIISGFLLYRPFIAHRAGGGAAPAIADYGKRRLLRIFPAYWLVLLAVTALPNVNGAGGGDFAAHFALLQTLPLAGQSTCITAITECGLAQTWSLAVELTFYLLLPVYVLVAARIARGQPTRTWVRKELLLLWGFAAASIGARVIVPDTSADWLASGTVAGFGFWFALGMTLAILSVAASSVDWIERTAEFVARHPLSCWVAAVGLYALLVRLLPATPFLISTRDQLVAHIGFGLVAALLAAPAVFGDDRGGLPRRALALPAVAWLGLISYGIFLWHYVFTIELGSPGEGFGWAALLAATLAGTIPVAAASYYLLERPILRLKYRRLARPGARPS